MKKLLYIMALFSTVSFSQEDLKGVVLEANSETIKLPIIGANVYWLNTTIGAVTDQDGAFKIPYTTDYKRLVISYVGFKTDTITIGNNNFLEHWLEPTSDLDEVTVTSRKQATRKSYLKAENALIVSSEELLKAACCNLSESFETNPSIDVNFSDAVTGTKQIKLLGLSSPYILIATENIPSVRGASQVYGLSFIPGTWVESIQITKGAGSVVNGFESMAGQINTELVKPLTDYKIFVNAYASVNGRLELNTHFNTKLSNKLSTGLYLHGDQRNTKFDRNDDTFLDMPLKQQINILNRWQYANAEKGLVSFLNLRYLNDNNQSGQLDFNPDRDKLTSNFWGSEITTNRFEASGKFGYVNPEVPWQTLGFQFAYSYHDQESYFGLNEYNINHNSVYSNLIYNSIISDSRHKIKAGVSFTYDAYDELAIARNFKRSETSFGGFFEYAYDNLDKLTLTAGLRFDTHNLLGEFITPRLHLRYTPWQKAALRVSVGRGKRSANIFTENQQIFATSRAVNILDTTGGIYGLNPEIAWNYGVSYLQGFNLFGRKADLTFDYYRTDFTDQVVVDYETPSQINFYNLEGKSFANSFQVEFNHKTFEAFDVRLAYKYYNVQTDYLSGRLSKPLIPRHRFFANIAYETKLNANGSQWKFDATYNWLSEQRFSSTMQNPPAFQLPEESPTIGTLNMQITKVFSPKFEMYLGGENITNVRQQNPIISADNPFGLNFDTTFVYGPIFGSMYYTGLRYKLN